MAAKSTTAGTPVKSCKITRAGINGTSTLSPLDKIRYLVGLSHLLFLLGLSLLPVENLFDILLQNLEVVAVPDRRLKKDPDGEWQLIVFLSKGWQVEEGLCLSSNFKGLSQVCIWIPTTSHHAV